jgi:hypothetical protein
VPCRAHQRHRVAHRRDVGRDVDDVRHQQQADDEPHQLARREALQVGGQPAAGDPRPMCALMTWIATISG